MPIDSTTQLYYESYGPANARTIVFLHGGGIGGWMWRKQVQAFQSEYHCLVPDLPEQGKNAATAKEPFTIEAAADQIAELIRQQAHGGKAHVAGLSEGAQVLVALLSRSPQVVDHALVSSAILRPMWANSIMTPAAVKWSYRWFMAPLKNNDWWIRLNMHGAAGLGDEFFADFKATFQETTEASLVHLMAANASFRLPAGLEKVDLPVLVVVGSKEYKEMKLSGQDLVKALPRAKGVVVSLGKKSSLVKEHGWPMSAPELFNATLKAWIEDRPVPEVLLPRDGINLAENVS